VAYCTNCGAEEREGQQFCGACGARTRRVGEATPMPPVSSADYHGDAEVRVGISLSPPRQQRWTILLRVFMVVPLYVVTVAVGFAAFFVTIVAWFCALFTGRVSDGQQLFLTNALRLYANVEAYTYLLIARWPGITFNEKPGEQVSIDVDHVGLRRSSVFFRLVLALPAALVWNALYLGSIPLLIVAWLWGIVAGREPRTLHQSLALMLRYQLRLQAYWSLLTPTQPFRGFLGDGVAPRSTTGGDSITATSPSVVAPPLSAVTGVAERSPAATSPSLVTHWLVSRSARVFMALMVIAGVPLYILTPSFENPLIVRMQDFISRSVVTTSYTVTLNAMSRFETSTATCRGAYTLECQQRAATLASPRVSDQSALLLSNNFFVPTSALGAVKRYESALNSLENELVTVQTSNSLSVQAHVLKVEIPVTLAQVNRDYLVVKGLLTG
jgi:Domain of unknown function (DUF4389)